MAETTTTAEPTTTTEAVDLAAALDGFRTYAASLDIVGATDDRLDLIGAEACAAANASSDAAEWDAQLEAIVTAIRAGQAVNPPAEGVPLTEEQIRSLYRGAATFYCPADAGRLGITV